MKLRQSLLVFAGTMLVLTGAFSSQDCPGQSLSARIDVKIVTDEADAVLAILAKRKSGQGLSDSDWQRLFQSDGYVRLKRRESAMKRPFTDEEFKTFVNGDDLLGKERSLSRTLRAWKQADVRRAARRALIYLPEAAIIRAKIYPVIKPRSNSFVFEVNSDPAIFLYLDASETRKQFENTLAHEFHHIGYGTACPGPQIESEIPKLPQEVKDTLHWVGAFGEGFAMLAAAGGPTVHPHKFSSSEDRSRWDRDVANFNNDLQRVDHFFGEILAGSLKKNERDERGFSFFGVQGPWYTVGWKMAVVIETTYGRATLIECMCNPRKLLSTYNEAARQYNKKTGESLALWSAPVVERLNSPKPH